MNDGWIKLHRKILDNQAMFGTSYDFGVFVTLLLMADRKTGSLTIGRHQLAKRFRAKESTIYKAMKRLEKEQQINIKSNNQFSEITICKYHDYQSQSNSESKQKVTTKEQQSNTLQEVRIKKKNINTSSQSSDELVTEPSSKYDKIHNKIAETFKKNINQYKLTPKRKKILSIRLKDTGEEGIIRACEALSKSDFHMGDNDRGWVADPYWCLSSVEKAEEWSTKYQPKKVINLAELEF